MQKRIWLLTASSVISLLSLFTLSFWLSPQTQAAQILTTFADPLGGQAISGQDRSLLGVGTLYITRTIEVDPIDDNNPGGGCTLREAIDVANAGLGAGTAPNQCTVTESGASPPVAYEINLPDYTYTLSGSAGEDGNVGGDLDILGSMNINGSTSTIIDGAGIDRVFHIPISEIDLTLTVSSLTVQNGRAYDGGGLYNNGGTVNIIASTLTNNDAEHHGGGIFDTLGMVMISHSTISDNQAGDLGGGLYQGAGSTVAISDSLIAANLSEGSGGGISINAYNGITLHIFNSTIRDNTALNLDTLYRYGGGGISIAGDNTVNIANSTISGNLTNEDGGGIRSAGTLNLTHVTITDNVADGDTIQIIGDGGGLYCSFCKVKIKNSIIARNTDRSGGGADCSGSFDSYGYNLIGDNSGCIPSFPGGLPNGNDDYVGTAALPLDPLLGDLTGSPGYYLLPIDSPAVDKIPDTDCTYLSSEANPLFTAGDPVSTDQVGNPRDSLCDIGASEVPPVWIQVLSGELDIPDETGVADFGSTPEGIPVTKTFTVRNIGKTEALTLANLTAPGGFSIASDFGASTVLTNTQTSFTIQFDALEGMASSGQISFTNNVADQSPFNFMLMGTVFTNNYMYLPVILTNP